jgi:hypothetical protein
MNTLFILLFFASLIGLIMGLKNPSLFTPIIKKELTKKQIKLFFGGTMFLFFFLVGITAEETVQKVDTGEKEMETVEVENEIVETEELDQDSAPVLENEPTSGTRHSPTPTPESTPEPAPEPVLEPDSKPEATTGERNALRSALDYLNYKAFSYEGLVKQLEFEGYTKKEAVYAANNCGANWNEQAVKSAKSYLDYSSFSRDGLIKQLEFEGYTHLQAVYGAEAVGY